MSSFSDTLEEALRRAFPVQDPDALRRTVRILEEGYDPVRRVESDVALVKQDTTQLKGDVSVLKSDVTQLKSDVRLIAERMEHGFLRFDERFESLQREMDKRFKAADDRFESLQRHMDKRFATQERFLALTMTVLAVLMTIYNFVG